LNLPLNLELLSCRRQYFHLLLNQKLASVAIASCPHTLESMSQLGAMSIGDRWAGDGLGSMDKESSFKLLDAYYDNGGNFIDTANN